MTKQEIQALIDAKIAGQGSAVDVGGALPTILHEILEMAASGGGALRVYGVFIGDKFEPQEGKVTFEQAWIAFYSGIPVVLEFDDDARLVTRATSFDECVLYAGEAAWTEGNEE